MVTVKLKLYKYEGQIWCSTYSHEKNSRVDNCPMMFCHDVYIVNIYFQHQIKLYLVDMYVLMHFETSSDVS